MKKRRVVAAKCMSAQLPITGTVVMLLALDHWQAGGVVRGIAYTVAALIWVGVLFAVFMGQEVVDIFDKDQISINGTKDPKAMAREIADLIRRQAMTQKNDSFR